LRCADAYHRDAICEGYRQGKSIFKFGGHCKVGSGFEPTAGFDIIDEELYMSPHTEVRQCYSRSAGILTFMDENSEKPMHISLFNSVRFHHRVHG